MAQYFDDDLDMGDFLYFGDEFEIDNELQEEGVHDPDLEIYEEPTKHKNDTSASEYRNGRDMQGIPWENLQYTREQYRDMRLKQYKNYENLRGPANGVEKEHKKVENARAYYVFQFNTRLVKSTIVHFQLRNLLWATSKHDVYMVQNYSVMHWSTLQCRTKEVLNVAGRVIPLNKLQGSSPQPLSRVQISTMNVKGNLMVIGGFQGELVCKNLDQSGVMFATKLTNNENAITNAVDIYHSSNGSTRVMAANNDSCVRTLDAQRCVLLSNFSFPWSVNSTSVSPDGKLLAVLGDSTDCLMADPQSGKIIASLKGHKDYSFASAWHPHNQILATGNQDKTCRIWDVRNLSEPFVVLHGRIGAIRGIKFSSDGQFMAMAEPADFVHIYDTKSGYCAAQEIDLFGEIAGISFSPDTEAFFVSIADRNYGSLLEFNRRGRHHYLDCLL